MASFTGRQRPIPTNRMLPGHLHRHPGPHRRAVQTDRLRHTLQVHPGLGGADQQSAHLPPPGGVHDHPHEGRPWRSRRTHGDRGTLEGCHPRRDGAGVVHQAKHHGATGLPRATRWGGNAGGERRTGATGRFEAVFALGGDLQSGCFDVELRPDGGFVENVPAGDSDCDTSDKRDDPKERVHVAELQVQRGEL